MSFSDFLMLTPNPVLSGFIWVVVLVAALYLARTSAHHVIRVTSRIGLHGSANGRTLNHAG